MPGSESANAPSEPLRHISVSMNIPSQDTLVGRNVTEMVASLEIDEILSLYGVLVYLIMLNAYRIA